MTCDRRVSILVMGYLKLIFIDIVHMVMGCAMFYDLVQMSIKHDFGPPWWILAISVGSLVLLLFDICFGVLLLAGCHKKKSSLLRAYFAYAIVAVILWLVLTAHTTTSNISTFLAVPHFRDIMLRNPTMYLSILWYGLVNIAIQICQLVLVRREIRKLDEDSSGTNTTGAHTKETELHNI